MTHDLWTTLNAKMYEYLGSVALADLVSRHLTKTSGGAVVMKDARRIGPSPRSRTKAVAKAA
jgi:Rrf2 family iron-sulfur cluster assembly transcriptional regulator